MEKYYISILQYLVKEKLKKIKNLEISNFIKENLRKKSINNENINKILRNDYRIDYKTVLNIKLNAHKRNKNLMSIFCDYQSYEDFKNKIRKEFLLEKNNEKKFFQKNDVFLKEIPEYFKNTKWYFYHKDENDCSKYIFEIKNRDAYLFTSDRNYENYIGNIYCSNNNSFLIVDMLTENSKQKHLHLKIKCGLGTFPSLMIGHYSIISSHQKQGFGEIILQKIENIENINNVKAISVKIFSKDNENYNETYKKEIPKYIAEFLEKTYYEFKTHKLIINLEELKNFIIKNPPINLAIFVKNKTNLKPIFKKKIGFFL